MTYEIDKTTPEYAVFFDAIDRHKNLIQYLKRRWGRNRNKQYWHYPRIERRSGRKPCNLRTAIKKGKTVKSKYI